MVGLCRDREGLRSCRKRECAPEFFGRFRSGLPICAQLRVIRSSVRVYVPALVASPTSKILIRQGKTASTPRQQAIPDIGSIEER